MHETSAPAWCTGMTQRNRVEREVGGGMGWGIHVTPSLIHVNVWQNPLQCCEVTSLQLIKIKEKKKKTFVLKKKKRKESAPGPKLVQVKQKEFPVARKSSQESVLRETAAWLFLPTWEPQETLPAPLSETQFLTLPKDCDTDASKQPSATDCVWSDAATCLALSSSPSGQPLPFD